jgi:hypothetical protein
MWGQYRAMGEGVWFTAGTVATIVVSLWSGALMFCLFSILFTCWNMIGCLRDLFRGGANIRPLHPDGVGGLAPMADFSLGLVYLISAVGVMLLAVTPFTRGLASGGVLRYVVSPDIVVAATAHAVVAPLAFFLILNTASKAMREAKRRELEKIATRWDAEYPGALEAVTSGALDFAPMVERLKTLRELYQTARSFPVWPFDQASLQKFAGSYLSPLVTGVLADLAIKVLRP